MSMSNLEELTEEALYELARVTQEAMIRLTDAMQVLLETDSIEDFRDAMVKDDCGLCVMCPEPAVMRDSLNIPWCVNGRDRGEFVNLMSARRWRKIDKATIELEDGHVEIHTIESGAWFTANVALGGSDEAVIALALMAVVSDERVA